MQNLISILFIVFAFNLIGQKYPKSLVIDKDTLVCFKVAQAKQLAIWNEERKQCQELRIIDNNELIKKDQIIIETNSIIESKNKIIESNQLIILEKDKIIDINEQEKKLLKKQLRNQKIGKWIAIVSGIFLSGVMLAI
jgi:hypothetical protein